MCAIQVPMRAPIKPTTIERKQPPLENPVNACPIAPEIPAIISRIIISVNDIFYLIFEYKITHTADVHINPVT